MKKILLMIGCIIIFSTISFTQAYYTFQKKKANGFVIGYNEVKIVEQFEEVDQYEANHTYQKEVKVLNCGNVDCYVRILIVCSDESKIDHYNLNLVDYEKIDDYYYYKYPLKVNETTPALLSSLQTTNEIDEDFEVYVYCESVQCYGYDNGYEAFLDLK